MIAGKAGALRTDKPSKARSGIRLYQAIVKEPANCALSSPTLDTASPCRSALSARIENTARAIKKLGTETQAMWRICSNRSDPATAGARLVVSERGDILSPK
ncbi:hypothetical protein D3C85_1576550 [compost metagenome]